MTVKLYYMMSKISSDNLQIAKDIQCNEYIKSIKLTMKRKNSFNNFCMVLRNFELFGSINLS